MKSPSILVNRGWIEDAEYKDAILPMYRNNPLIEALPPPYSEDDAIERMACYPEFDPKHRKLPAHIRSHFVQSVGQIFIPLGIHTDLEDRLDRMIRMGYVARNPVEPSYWETYHERIKRVRQKANPEVIYRSTALGFTIVGVSGMGKSTGIEQILRSLYPQVIRHGGYKGKDFPLTQIVWLKLDCPHDGSVRGICHNFLQAVDDLLGTRYFHRYASGRRTVDELLPDMSRVASLHSIGTLVIDEIQNISYAKSGGPGKILSFFVQLINTVGVPIVLIGTSKADGLLETEFRFVRRGTGQGDFKWNRMVNDKNWEFFIETLWKYQYVQKPCRLEKPFLHTLHDETQGIVDFAIKVFILSQLRAIKTGKETITTEIIKSVAKDSLSTAQRFLRALRDGDLETLKKLEDIRPILLEDYIESSERHESIKTVNVAGSAADSSTGALSSFVQPSAGKKSRNAAKAKVPVAEDSLRNIVANGLKRKAGPYQALKEAGIICSASEFL